MPAQSTKHIQIDKANASMVAIVAVAAFITVFSLVAVKALLSQRSYQSRVITAKRKALDQLKANNEAAKKLVDSYKTFVSTSDNIIGGSAAGTGDRDGDNAKIVLDALPSKYDFPAVAASLEKILTSQNYKIDGITGTDDELNQAKLVPGTDIKPVLMPFEVNVTSSFDSIQNLIDIFQRSIRPITISQLTARGKDNNLSLTIKASTYYQPQKTVNISTKVVQ